MGYSFTALSVSIADGTVWHTHKLDQYRIYDLLPPSKSSRLLQLAVSNDLAYEGTGRGGSID